jgi:peptidoglycan/xylan/chitin deacetylase (PgdA/CDA1 family)
VRTHRLGWLLVGCIGALASQVVADPVPATRTAKVETLPPRTEKPKDEAKAPRKDKEGDELLALSNDPRLGKADRIDGDELKGMVAFTFDDGPNPSTTPAVIDALEKYNIPATFFIVSQRLLGKNGEKSREVLARQIAAGFIVESHSFSHPNLKGASSKTLAKEVDVALRILAKEAAKPIGMFRPPYGAIDGNGRGWLKRRGLTEVRWSVDTLDWRARDAQRLRKKVIKMIIAQQGGVVLMHDVKPITAKVVAEIFDDLEAENCRLLAEKQEPILPVSLHYFVFDKKKPRAIPDDVKKRTEAYRAALPARCSKRPPPPPDPKAPAGKTPASNTVPPQTSKP